MGWFQLGLFKIDCIRRGPSDGRKLPFPDGLFDVVFSCHMLEHLTTETVDEPIREMTRECSDDGLQFHLLPILGSGPYSDIFGSMSV